MPGVLGIRDLTHNAAWYSGSVPTDSSTTGSASASYPIANLHNTNIGKVYKRTGCNFSAGDVIIDELLTPLDGWGTAILALLNVQLFANGGAVPVGNVRVRCSVSVVGFTGPYIFDKYRVIVPPPGNFGPNCDRANAVFVIAPTPSELDKKYGGLQSAGSVLYVRWTLDASTGFTNHDIIVGKACRFAGLFADVDKNPALDATDPSEVQRAYDGTPYALRRAVRSGIRGGFLSIPRWQVWGGAGGTTSAEASLTFKRANQILGVTYPVLFVPFADLGYYAAPPPDPGFFVQPDTMMQNEHIYGLLRNPLRIDRMTGTQSGTDDLWQTTFEIDEVVP